MVFISLIYLSACSNNSSSSDQVGLIEPNFDSPFSWATTKQYTDIAGQSCGPADNCICIYLNQEIAGVSYTGFAVRSDNNDFNIKIYSSDGGATYTVNLKIGSTVASCDINAGDLFFSGPTITDGFASADFKTGNICSTSYTYSSGTGTDDIVAPVY